MTIFSEATTWVSQSVLIPSPGQGTRYLSDEEGSSVGSPSSLEENALIFSEKAQMLYY